MNGDFADGIGIIRYTTSALVGRVDPILESVCRSIDPLILDARRGVQLASREEFHVAVKQTIEWEIDRPSTIASGRCLRAFRWFSSQERCSIVESAISFAGRRDGLGT